MVRHFLILENSETEFSVDPRNGRRNNTTRSSLPQIRPTGQAFRLHVEVREKRGLGMTHGNDVLYDVVTGPVISQNFFHHFWPHVIILLRL